MLRRVASLVRRVSNLAVQEARKGQPCRERRRVSRNAWLGVEILEQREVLSSYQTWEPGPAFPVDARTFAAGVNYYGYIMALGGRPFVGPEQQGAAHILDPDTNAWYDTAPLEGPLLRQGAGIDALGRVIVFGGIEPGSVPRSNGYVYDLYTGPAEGIARKNFAVDNFAYATDGEGRIYSVGGGVGAYAGSANPNRDVVERYDALTDTWEILAPLPEGRANAAAVYDGQGHLLVIGGFDRLGNSRTRTVFSYDVAANTWSRLPDQPAALTEQAAALGADGLIYVLGGASGGPSSPTPTRSVSILDPVSGAWWTGPNMATARVQFPAVLGWDGYIYALGGSNVGIGTNLVERINTLDAAPPQIMTAPGTVAYVDQAYEYRIGANGNPRPTYYLLEGPEGLTVDEWTGVVSWTPTEAQVGPHTVSLMAWNEYDAAVQTYTLNVTPVPDTQPPTVPAGLVASVINPTSVTLTWDAATDDRGVEGYRIYEYVRINQWTSIWRLVVNNLPGTLGTVTGLLPNTLHKYAVTAYDAAGNESARSTMLTLTTTMAPTLRYTFNGVLNGPITATARHPLTIQLTASSNPASTYSLVTGPAGMTVDATTGLVTWTPQVSDVGNRSVTFRATNSVGNGDLTVTFPVLPDAPVLRAILNGGPPGPQYGLVGQSMAIQVVDSSFTPATFSVVSGPAGLTINPVTGLAQWTPLASQAGTTNVTFRATNLYGTTDLAVSFYTYFTGAPANLTVTEVTALNPLLRWTSPPNPAGIAGYSIRVQYTVGIGSQARTYTLPYESPGMGTQLALTNLPGARTYRIASINAYDAGGNRGLNSSQVVSFVYNPALPNLGYTFNPATGGGRYAVAQQQLVIQLTDSNPAPRTFTLFSGPAGMTVDPTTGLVTWTPQAADIGNTTAIFRATNSVGPRDITVTFPVHFAGLPRNVAVSDILASGSARVSWTAPTDNVRPIAGYQITLTWTINGHTYSRVYDSVGSGTSLVMTGLVRGPVLFRIAGVAAYDDLGRLGATLNPGISFVLPA